MIRYAIRATPWPLLAAGCGVVGVLMALVAARPGAMWPLQGACVGLIAGVLAMAMDERCASIVDTTPRGLAWRTVARAGIAAPALLVVWAGSVLAWRDRLPPHTGLFLLQALAAALALSVTARRRAAGIAEPGAPLATAVIPTTVALAMIRPWTRGLPLFPIWPGENWALSRAIWWTMAVGALLPPVMVWGRGAGGARRRGRCAAPVPARPRRRGGRRGAG